MDTEDYFIQTEVGSIPKEWNVRTIDAIKSQNHHSIAMGPFGSNITKDNFISSGVPVIRGGNLDDFRFNEEDFVYVSEAKADELKASNAFSKDIVITHRGTLGQVGIIPEDSNYTRYVVSQSQMKLSCNEKVVNPYFVYYFLKSKIGQHLLLMNKSQTGVPAIARPTSSLKQMPIPVPKIEEQNGIVNLLKSLDDKIELNRQINTTLEHIAQAIFKHWFIDFEFPDENGQPYRSSGGEMLDSELGEIPAGWRVGTIAELATTNPESWSKKTRPKTIRYVDLSNVKEGIITSIQNFVFDEAPSRARRILKKGDIIIGTVRPGNKSYAYIQSDGLTGSTGFAVLRPADRFAREFIYFCLTRDEATDYFTHIADGAAYPAIRSEVVSDYKLLIPDKFLLKTFSELIMPLLDKVQSNYIENIFLNELRDSLLPKLMSGEIRVDDDMRLTT